MKSQSINLYDFNIIISNFWGIKKERKKKDKSNACTSLKW